MQVHPANGPWPSLAAALEAEQRAEGRTLRDAAGIWRLLAQLLVVLLAGLIAVSAFAKPPPPTDEAKLIAAEGAAKAAGADKVGACQLCNTTDRIADAYRKRAFSGSCSITCSSVVPEYTKNRSGAKRIEP